MGDSFADELDQLFVEYDQKCIRERSIELAWLRKHSEVTDADIEDAKAEIRALKANHYH